MSFATFVSVVVARDLFGTILYLKELFECNKTELAIHGARYNAGLVTGPKCPRLERFVCTPSASK
jgi:hypothetical protein